MNKTRHTWLNALLLLLIPVALTIVLMNRATNPIGTNPACAGSGMISAQSRSYIAGGSGDYGRTDAHKPLGPCEQEAQVRDDNDR